MAFISDNTTEEFLATVGNSSFNRHLTFTNETNANATIIHDTYPSGYSLPHIVFASVVVTLLMIIIVVGNMLVIIAIITEKSLKNIQNWFIASLAVADFFLGLVIMPFSLANELMGYWIFGPWWCDIHSGMLMSNLPRLFIRPTGHLSHFEHKKIYSFHWTINITSTYSFSIQNTIELSKMKRTHSVFVVGTKFLSFYQQLIIQNFSKFIGPILCIWCKWCSKHFVVKQFVGIRKIFRMKLSTCDVE